MLSLMILLAACGGSEGPSSTSDTAQKSCPATKALNGGGSTFVNPLFSKMFTEYPKAACGANVNYQSIGSGAGINNLLQNIVDFGATDAPMKDDQLAKSKNGPILHIPVTLGAVAISYNLPDVSERLKLTGPVIADIFLGKITSWDDPKIKESNQGVNMPKQPITIVHRSDGSGTTGIFTNYLAVISPEWKAKVGAGTTVNWPAGVGGKGNEGVAAAVKNTKGGIGYSELAYVLKNNISYAAVQNADGNTFVEPTVATTKADAAGVKTIPDDLRFYIVNQPGKDSYPVSGFVWVVAYQNQMNADKGRALANMLWWVTHDGQRYSEPLTYVPLPDNIVARSEAQIKAMKCGDAPCYAA